MRYWTNGLLLGCALSLAALGGCTAGGSSCPGGAVDCGGVCVELRTDAVNCGACGRTCGAGTTCEAGACRLACPSGQVACQGGCVDPLTSRSFCGASGDCAAANVGASCAPGQDCVGGRCASTCQAGLVACGGGCVDPLTSAAFCGASGDCAGASAGTACAQGQACAGGVCQLACQPAALDLETPFATAAPPYAERAGQQAPTSLWASSAAPLPTNAPWQNLVLGAGGSRVDFLPYQVKAEPVWLDVANAAPVSTATLVSVPDLKQLMLGALQFDGATTHAVVAHDLLSVTLRYSATAGTMTAPLVAGSPYVTVDYAGALRPMILPGTTTLSSVNGVTTPGAASGTRFELALGDGSTWILYASAPVAFNWTRGNLVAAATFTGTLRVANLPGPGAAAVLDAHAGTVPRGGQVDATVACDVATLRFVFTATGADPLLLLALPHHLPRLVAPATTGLVFPTMSGPLTGVTGGTWTMRLPLTTVGWAGPRAIAPARVAAVRAALAADAGFVPEAGVADDTYFHGKQLAKLARLALVADQLGETATAATLRARLAPLVAAWLDGTNGNPFVYDRTWGGVVSTQALANPSAQFGQGHYNDHHFHYGYLLYAAAVVAKADPDFAAAHRPGLLALVRDIANPSAADPKFPRLRHMDLFRGHSWAGGLTEHPDGQDQESTSEAANAWYAIHLLGLAGGDARLSDLGRVLLALEVDAARTYWQIPAASLVYQDPFAQNRCVGRLFQTQATFDTFFGAEAYKVYGIQMLPFTPATEDLLAPAWVADAWPRLSAAATGAPQGWSGLLHQAHATTDPAAAWTALDGLTAWDDGNSRTNALWWAATRP